MNRILIEAQSTRTPGPGNSSRPFASFPRRAGWTALILLLVGVRPAHAYLDPGNGSMLLQLLLGGVAGAAVLGRLAWQRVVSLFRPEKPAAATDAVRQVDDRPENGAR